MAVGRLWALLPSRLRGKPSGACGTRRSWLERFPRIHQVVVPPTSSSPREPFFSPYSALIELQKRFTDDPVHDPYAATRGLFYSHMGWIFFKPKYERINTVDQEDLDSDPRDIPSGFSVPIAFILGYGVPVCLGYSWGDPVGGFIYGGFVTRLAIWHTTFLVNSLAHWNGLQPYSDEDTSKSNLLLAVLTCGEGNHNFHTFPHDYRSGPSKLDWDPSKWIIDGLHSLGLVTSVRRAHPEAIDDAKHYMRQKALGKESMTSEADEAWNGKEWTVEETYIYAALNPARHLIVIDSFVVDVTGYLKEHPGGAKLLRGYTIRNERDGRSWRDASWAFDGGVNNHSRVARRGMYGLRVAKLKA
ncbi:hypothetical protein J3R82DRAFT_208 [Butyriboletus roseoflavus]|nr:hypothetical protein J3R82DRAFT_208 [Butyriboletus roseoflavus]